MKLPLSWLKSFVPTKLSAEKIADKLTMAGLEVEEIVGGAGFAGVVVGHVLSVEDHPNADKLHITKVDIGEETLQIVCGATNLAKGQKVPVATVGAKLADYEITKANLRGIESFGMICSERELGISDEHSGIMVLEKDLKPGTDVSLIVGSDKVIDVKVLANRPDCMSVIGLANEVAVLTKEKNNIPPIKLREIGEAEKLTVKVEDSKLCPRYMVRVVKDVKATESSAWMKERLMACGVRPINLLVDISNYVMLEYGQPLHFFDLDKLTDRNIVVRSAKKGETIITLDGVSRKLSPENLVIADSEVPIAIAGVMGGADTEISDQTKNVLIEAAIFDKASVRRTSRALGLRSEAVARFEKGIAHMLPEVAINRAAELMSDLAGGKVTKTMIDIHGKLNFGTTIDLNIEKMNKFLGTNIADKVAEETLASLGFVIKRNGKKWEVKTPFWRTDVTCPADLYEEVIRIIGFDNVPLTLPNIAVEPHSNRLLELVRKIRIRLSSIGFTEIMTYSFIGEKELLAVGADPKEAPEVMNPLAKDQQYLRTTIVPKMLEALRDNQFNKETIHFFEIGKTFEKSSKGKLPIETNWLTLGIIGGKSWPLNYKDSQSFYDVKGSILNLLAALGINEEDVVVKPAENVLTKQGISADFFVQGKKIATIGEVADQVINKFDLKRSVSLASMNLDLLSDLNIPEVKFCPFSKFQEMKRDISATYPLNVTVANIKQKLSHVDKLVVGFEIVDIFEGKGIAAGKRSITVRISLQSDNHTLTEEEADSVTKKCIIKLEELGGELRGAK